jgi:DNA-binding transcriptional regulator YiaG
MQGKELKAIRKRLKLTQRQVADQIGVTTNTVARWERDEITIREPMARLIRTVTSATKRGGR